MRGLKLQPREGWRAFIGEVGVIVLGVLIALGAQKLFDDWQWRQDVAATKEALNEEIRGNAVVAVERIATAPCLQGRLGDLARKVAGSGERWTGDLLRLGGSGEGLQIAQYRVPVAYRMPTRQYVTDVWEQAKANGTLAHMKAEDVATYSFLYQQIDMLRANGAREAEAMPSLSFLAVDGRLTPETRERALSAIAALDALDAHTQLIGGQVIDAATTLKGKLSPAQEQVLRDNLEAQTRMRGACADVAAALDRIAPLRSAHSR